MSQPVIVLGGGGHGRVLIEALELLKLNILGIADREPEKLTAIKHKVLGSDEAILKYAPDSVHLVNGLGSIGDTTARRQVFEYFHQKGYSFLKVVHPSAIVAKDVRIGEGAQIMAGAVVQTGSQIGMNAVINTRASIDHDCLIGDHVFVAPGVTLSGSVTVGLRSHIGTGAVVIQGMRIGPDTLVKAGDVIK